HKSTAAASAPSAKVGLRHFQRKFCHKPTAHRSDRSAEGTATPYGPQRRQARLEGPADFEEALNALFDRRVRAEEPLYLVVAQRIGDPQMRHGRVLTSKRFAVLFQLCQGAGQSIGIAGS